MIKFLLLTITVLHANYALAKPPNLQQHRNSLSKAISHKPHRWWRGLTTAVLFVGTLATFTPTPEHDALAQPQAEKKEVWQDVEALFSQWFAG